MIPSALLVVYFGRRYEGQLDLAQTAALAAGIVFLTTVTYYFFNYLNGGPTRTASQPVGLSPDQIEEYLAARAPTATGLMSEEQRTQLLEQVKRSILEAAKQETLENIVDSSISHSWQRDVLERLQRVPKRLEQEIADLRRRSNVNLFLGIVLGVAGLAILGTVAFHHVADPTSTRVFLLGMLPRFSIAVLTELLAFFFLSLYKAAANEIRFFHNELTNQESRSIALTASLARGGFEAIEPAFAAFLATERNFVLSAGQTTAFLESKKIEMELEKELTAKIASAVEKALERRK